MLKILFAISVSVFFFLLLWQLIKEKLITERTLRQRMEDISRGQSKEADTARRTDGSRARRMRNAYGKNLSDIPFGERVLIPLGQACEGLVKSLAPRELALLLERKLVLSGLQYRWTPGMIFVGMFILALLGGGGAFWLLRDNGMFWLQKLLLVGLFMVAGGLLPLVLLNSFIRERKRLIFRQLPEVLDLLSVSVEAGLSFDGAMRRIVERMHGPLVEECRKLMGDIRMGMMRRTALQNMAERCEVDDVSLFVTSIIQAERLGTSMGRTLQIQAENVRERRRQYIKRLALRAPVKIIFPLVFFIFPALLIVALGPPLLSIGKMFLGG